MSQKRILVVDDEEGIRKVLRTVMEMAGHEVLEADNGKKALQVLDEQSIDLVLSDVVMPECDGIELLTGIRKRHPGVRVLMMSGGGRLWADYYLDLAQKLGAAAVIEKPFCMDNLRTTVSGLLTGESCGTGAGDQSV